MLVPHGGICQPFDFAQGKPILYNASMWEVFWDVETKSWFDEAGSWDPGDLGVSIVAVYVRRGNEGRMQSFWEKDFEAMWKIFRDADRIIGFNTLGFDIPAMKPYAPADFAALPHFDILDKIKLANFGRGASLNAIAKDTLGTEKLDSGANAITYWKKGDADSLAFLQKYCEADVAITRDIYDFALKNKYLKFTDKWNNARQVEVDFSYPVEAQSIKQSSLF